jgi:hypothetical protein
MKTYQTIYVLFALILSAANAFTMPDSQMGSSFVVSQRARAYDAPTTASPARTGVSSLSMGGKQAKFGIFSPAVYGAKVVLGTPRLNKIRGKGISIHSSTIGDFCNWCVFALCSVIRRLREGRIIFLVSGCYSKWLGVYLTLNEALSVWPFIGPRFVVDGLLYEFVSLYSHMSLSCSFFGMNFRLVSVSLFSPTRVGAGHLRTKLIKKAKVNGDILGFLV